MNLTVQQLEQFNIGLSQFLAKELLADKTVATAADKTVATAVGVAETKNQFKFVNNGPQSLTIGNTATLNDDNTYDWKMYVLTDGRPASKVVYHLHPTFKPPIVETTSSHDDFKIERCGWGTFEVKIDVHFRDGDMKTFFHTLSFDTNSNTTHDVTKIMTKSVPKTAKRAALKSKKNRTNAANAHRMVNVEEATMHGRMGVGKNWAAPIVAHECFKKARPGYESMNAHEYTEEPSVLRAKVKVLAQLLLSSEHCIAYTGAGISTASGIDDYASKGNASFATGKNASKYRPKGKKGLNAEPTFAHYALSELYNQGVLKHWVQQNHDGLPQKAGYPQSALNEIHGAWFDPSNPVVPMNGSLRDDLHDWMLEEEERADLVLTMGTSLCGMNADRVVSTCSEKFCQTGVGLGSVIIGFQRTQLDAICSLRIFARIDEVMLLLAREMALNVATKPYVFHGTSNHVYNMPYDQHGQKTSNGTTTKLNLQRGAKLRLTSGPGKGYIGHVVQTTTMKGGYAFSVQFPCTREHSQHQGKKPSRYALGAWMIEAACRGELDTIPVVNC